MRNTILLYALLLLLPLAALAQRVETDPETKKKGLIDPIDGIVLIPFEYDYLELTQDRAWVMVRQNGLWGVMDVQGHLRVPIQYGQLNFGLGPGLFAAVAAENTNNRWGLVDLQGNLVLPMQYEYVNGLDADLLVARFAGDTLLRFFDGRGKPLFSAPGSGALLISDSQWIMTMSRSVAVRNFVDRKGARLSSGRIQQPQWISGQHVICGQFGHQGVLNTRGDTILPFAYKSVRVSGDGNFIVEKANGFDAVIDETERVIIPFVGVDINPWNARPESVYAVQIEKGFSLYDRQGQLLISADKTTRLSLRQADYGRWSPPGERLDRYIDVQKGARKGFYSETGRVIVPVEYASVRYFADGYAVIARRPDGQEEAFDVQGKKLLNAAFAQLLVTRDSMLLLGQDAALRKWGFIHLDRPAEARFEFDELTALPSGFFAAKGAAGWRILDPSTRPVATKPLEKIQTPDWTDFYQFYRKKLPGRLIAIARVKGESVLYAVNDRGAVFSWGPLPGKDEEEPVILNAGDRN